MSVRVEKPEREDTIPLLAMNEGQLAMIVVGPHHYLHSIIIRRDDTFRGVDGLILLTISCEHTQSMRVKPLPPGTRLVVTEKGIALEESEPDGTIPASEMKDGQMAEIVSWPGAAQVYIGTVIQRCGVVLFITVGGKHDQQWDYIPYGRYCRVRPLPNDTRLVVEDNI